MKMLVCTDGSEHSGKALEKAALLAECSNIAEVAVIHVNENKLDLSSSTAWGGEGYTVTAEDIEYLKKQYEKQKEERRQLLMESLKVFEEKNIKARAILKEGHPAYTIVETAAEEGFDIIVTGSRGLGGLKKLVLGSVSNAIVQESKNCMVVIVK